jgi:hypothetical protein
MYSAFSYRYRVQNNRHSTVLLPTSRNFDQLQEKFVHDFVKMVPFPGAIHCNTVAVPNSFSENVNQ